MSTDRSDDLLIETSKLGLSEVLSRHTRYVVPRFQRDYCWDVYQNEKLFEDVKSSCASQASLYLGNMVFRLSSRNQYELVDGQQRLCSILLLALAATIKFKDAIANDEDKAINEYRLEYCKEIFRVIDIDTLERRPRLRLSRRNHDHFLEMIEKFTVPPVTNHRLSNLKLNTALKFFISRLASLDCRQVGELLEGLTRYIFVTVVYIDNLSSAHTFIESQNNRGSLPQMADLLKNFIMGKVASELGDSKLAENKLDAAEKEWDEIIDRVGETEVGEFLRTVEGISSNGRLVDMKECFRQVNNRITSTGLAKSYLAQLTEYSMPYAALRGTDKWFWGNRDKTYELSYPALAALRIFGIRSPLVLLLAALHTYDPGDFNFLAKNLVMFTIRYNVICNHPYRSLEEKYAWLAHEVVTGKIDAVRVIRAIVHDTYPTDSEFRDSFIKTDFDTQAKLTYCLKEIEKEASDRDSVADTNVVKVMPDYPDDSWTEKLNGSSIIDVSSRISNYCLVNGNGIRPAYRDFLDFQLHESNSAFAINRNIANQDAWDENSFAKHEAWLASKAAKVWQVETECLHHV